MKLTIIPADGTVQKDGLAYTEIDVTACNIPDDVHALQWSGNRGEIEYVDHTKPNDTIDVLPEWATACAGVWDKTDHAFKNPPPSTAEQKTAARLAELRQMLAQTDYVALSDYDQSKPEIIKDRQAWRDEIRKLES